MYRFEAKLDFDFGSSEFAELYELSDSSAFQNPLWLKAFERYVAHFKRLSPFTLTIREAESNRLVLVMPLLVRRLGPVRIVEYANLGLVDFVCAVFDPDHWQALLDLPDLDDQIKSCLGRYDILWIKHVRGSDAYLKDLFPGCSMQTANFSSYYTELTEDYADWRQKKLSSNRRSHINRNRNRLKKLGDLDFSILTEASEIADAFAFLKRIRGERFADDQGTDYLQDDAAFDFYLSLAQDEAKSGFAVTARLMLDDDIVGVVFGLLDREHYYYLLPAADYEKFGRYSPGQVLVDSLIEAMAERGVTLFDFSVGDEDYKRSFGTKVMPIITLSRAGSWIGAFGLHFISFVRKQQRLKMFIKKII